MRPSTWVPCSSAGLRIGSATFSDCVAGVMLFPNVVRSVSSGCWAASDWVETWRVDGDSRIVAFRSAGLRSIAPNVVAIFPNSWALTCATGATAPMNEFSPVKNRVSSVFGSDRYRATGSRCPNSAGRLEIVSFSADPREASVSPNPTRFSWTAARVWGSNILKTSSNWTGTLVCDSGSVAPSANIRLEVPLCRSRYLSPSTDRGWIETLESIGTSP